MASSAEIDRVLRNELIVEERARQAWQMLPSTVVRLKINLQDLFIDAIKADNWLFPLWVKMYLDKLRRHIDEYGANQLNLAGIPNNVMLRTAEFELYDAFEDFLGSRGNLGVRLACSHNATKIVYVARRHGFNINIDSYYPTISELKAFDMAEMFRMHLSEYYPANWREVVTSRREQLFTYAYITKLIRSIRTPRTVQHLTSLIARPHVERMERAHVERAVWLN